MIAVYTKKERVLAFLQEALSVLQMPVQAYTDIEKIDSKADIIIIWEESPKIPCLSDDLKKIPLIAVLPDGTVLEGRDFDGVFHTPLRVGVLIDRIRTLLNKGHLSHLPETVQIGPYTLKIKENLLEGAVGGEPLYLTEKERDILLTLFENEGKPMDRQTLLDRVWAYAEGVETHTLETHIYRLRQKIEKDPSNPKILGTHGEGYFLLKS